MSIMRIKKNTVKPRKWQIECQEQGYKWLVETKTHKQFVINAAPAAGKTVAACLLAKKLYENNKINRIIVIAPQAGVTYQWAKEVNKILGLHMEKINSPDDIKMTNMNDHLCLTWQALSNIKDAIQAICISQKVLVICDEHHHAALEASWGSSADSAFKRASHCLILTGTPVRTDGKECTWLSLGKNNEFIFPKDGIYELNYGKAVDLGYCVPITFHRYEGKFSVKIKNGKNVDVSSKKKPVELLKKNPSIKTVIDFYTLTKRKEYEIDGKTPLKNSYLGHMIEFGIKILIEKKKELSVAGGLIIAPDISTAEYMAELVEIIDGKKALIVHSNMKNPQKKIKTFRRNHSLDWLVSVNMISEGVDIPRLRAIIYLPKATTELAFRQAVGRAVRKFENKDYSSASFIMPPLTVFETYAKRIEKEMGTSKTFGKKLLEKFCPKCNQKNKITNSNCLSCDYKFPISNHNNFKSCQVCSTLNPIQSKICQNCGNNFSITFDVSLKEALRDGAIIRGNELSEDDVRIGEIYGKEFKSTFSKNPIVSRILSQLPDEGLAEIIKAAKHFEKKINTERIKR